jgi:hypothetical protein
MKKCRFKSHQQHVHFNRMSFFPLPFPIPVWYAGRKPEDQSLILYVVQRSSTMRKEGVWIPPRHLLAASGPQNNVETSWFLFPRLDPGPSSSLYLRSFGLDYLKFISQTPPSSSIGFNAESTSTCTSEWMKSKKWEWSPVVGYLCGFYCIIYVSFIYSVLSLTTD